MILAFFLMSSLPACMEGEMGPTGPEGKQGIQGEQGDNANQCVPDVWTLTLQTDYLEATFGRSICHMEVEHASQDCVEECEETPDEGCHEQCWQEEELEYWHCEYWYGHAVNRATIRQCGLEVLTMLFDDSSNLTEHPWDASGEDYDGDGIRDWWELQMGLNPCTQHSLSNCLNDGDLDYDVDGIPNKEDEFPLCNPNDPAGWQADCV